MKDYSCVVLTRRGHYYISFCYPVLIRAAETGDERKASQILNAAYAHGGGWDPFLGFAGDAETKSLKYPDDPRLKPHALITFGDEIVAFYDSEWVAVWQPDGTFEVCRMD